MIRFLDGPAVGVSFDLQRTPLYLRVVHHGGEFDALDQLGDEPADEEEVFVYRLESPAGSVHVDGTDANGRRFGRWFRTGEYRLNDVRPEEAVLRDKAAWQAWAGSQPSTYLNAKNPPTEETSHDDQSPDTTP